ncbi:MAG: aminotransferase class V-fold PLP-dependent enzyme [Thermoplasmata archaeon]|nr:aminotransferase class V-fold PLP-dependent enzyme [Thermoplasmata archaeon]
MLDTEAIRKDFPILQRDWDERPPLVYLDSGSMTLKPRQVIEAVVEYYELHSACAGRSVHTLASQVSRRVDRSRTAVRRFIGASNSQEVVFLRNTTEGLNMVSRSLDLRKDDAVVLSDREHNSNLLPWLRLASRRGVIIRVVPSKDDGTFSTDALQEALAPGDVRVVSMAHTNNLDGYTIPIKAVAEIAHDRGSLVVVDGAQSAASRPVDVGDLDVDFFVFSIHKMLGPTGVGVLWGRGDLLDALPPYNVGGDTVTSVSLDGATYHPPPARFEAGLQHYAGIYGAEAAVSYLRDIGMENVHDHVVALNRMVTEAVADIPGVAVLGPNDPGLRGGLFNVTVEGVASHEVGMALDEIGNVAVRTGQHCNHLWFSDRGIEGAVRATFYIYNNEEDAIAFATVLEKAISALRGA